MYLKYLFCYTIYFLLVALEAQVTRLNECINEGKLFQLSNINGRRTNDLPNPDSKLSVPELIKKEGYPLEIHTIKTVDNYLLTVHRIPYGKHNNTIANRKPFLLMHGILCSSADWILMGPQRSLGYLLADMGYDVWIGNARGNKFSRRHVSLDPIRDANTFWNFSWHEIGLYDLPALIDYILRRTNNKKLNYIGHSQGSTSFFVMTSLRPEYNNKISVMFAFAPAVFMENVQSPFLKYGALFLTASKTVLSVFGINELLPNKGFTRGLARILCDEESIIYGLCENLLFLIAGFDDEQLDRERLPFILNNVGAGCSTKQLIHFLQNTRNNLFSFFDYGPSKNEGVYSSLIPPEYPLNKVTVPVALFSGYNDLFADVKDIDKLSTKLPNLILNYHVPLKEFTHLDFVWAKDVVPLIYNVVFDQLQHFQ